MDSSQAVVIADHASESSALMSVISKAATDPSVNVEKMERLFALYQQMDRQRREDAFSNAMKAAQAEMPQMFRDKKNEHKGYRYTTLEELNSACVPIYTRHGFALSFGTQDCPTVGHYRMVCKVSHEAGFSRDYQADLPTDMLGDKGNANKTAIQGFGSSMSYGRRYMTLLIFNISTTDDNDGATVSSGNITPEQQAAIQKLLSDTGMEPAKFLAWAKRATITEIPAENYQKAVNAINAWAANKKAAP